VKGEKTMKKRHLLLATAFVVVIGLTLVVPVLACDDCDVKCQGCTPGYWKQPHHWDSWVATGYAPNDYFDDVFGVGPNITLLEALQSKGGGENAFMRHAVAALLNAAHPQVNNWDVERIKLVVEEFWGTQDEEFAKDWFEDFNQSGCPLN
jgi:hypothetical protein